MKKTASVKRETIEKNDDDASTMGMPPAPGMAEKNFGLPPGLPSSYDQFKTDMPPTPEEAQAKAVMCLSERTKIELLTEIKEGEDIMVASLRTIANRKTTEPGRLLNSFIDNLLNIRVSLNRKGVSELTEVTKGGQSIEEKTRKSFKSLLLGLR